MATSRYPGTLDLYWERLEDLIVSPASTFCSPCSIGARWRVNRALTSHLAAGTLTWLDKLSPRSTGRTASWWEVAVTVRPHICLSAETEEEVNCALQKARLRVDLTSAPFVFILFGSIHNKVCLCHHSRNSVSGGQGDGTKWSCLH